MFTGIITDIGEIIAAEKHDNHDLAVTIKTGYDVSDIALGDSIACSGVCLTVITKEEGALSFQASEETLGCTTLSEWQVGSYVNLEKAMMVGSRLDGHMVLGHVDAIISVYSVIPAADSHIVSFTLPDKYRHLIAEKGSVTINGVSLTVNAVEETLFSVNIIAHTWQHTNFHTLREGDKVNMECDVIARYVARLSECQ